MCIKDKTYLLRNDLILKIYTIGYDPCGESILFTISDGDLILYSGLIDCFKLEEKNLVLDLINNLGIDKLNYLCITHPDFDHCFGVSDIKDKIGRNTTLVLPQNVLLYKDYYDDRVKQDLKVLENFIDSNRNAINRAKYISCCDSKRLVDGVFFLDTCGRRYELSINSMAPVSALIDRNMIRIENGKIKTQQNNDFSVINTISLGNLKMLLCSDIEDKSIAFLKENMTNHDTEFLKDFIHYLKIPHHSSNHSLKLFDLLDNVKVSNSVTTIFRSCNLPDKKVLKKYMGISNNVYSTGKDNEDDANYKYGIVYTTFNISKKTILSEVLYDAISLQ